MEGKREPVAFCKLCSGPIYQGEPVVSYDDGFAHRFKTWCDHYRKQDSQFLKDVGISQ